VVGCCERVREDDRTYQCRIVNAEGGNGVGQDESLASDRKLGQVTVERCLRLGNASVQAHEVLQEGRDDTSPKRHDEQHEAMFLCVVSIR
jgi:hypothetical protein